MHEAKTITLDHLRRTVTRPGARTCQARRVDNPKSLYSARMGSTISYFVVPNLERRQRVEIRWTKLSPHGEWTAWFEVIAHVEA